MSTFDDALRDAEFDDADRDSAKGGPFRRPRASLSGFAVGRPQLGSARLELQRQVAAGAGLIDLASLWDAAGRPRGQGEPAEWLATAESLVEEANSHFRRLSTLGPGLAPTSPLIVRGSTTPSSVATAPFVAEKYADDLDASTNQDVGEWASSFARLVARVAHRHAVGAEHVYPITVGQIQEICRHARDPLALETAMAAARRAVDEVMKSPPP